MADWKTTVMQRVFSLYEYYVVLMSRLNGGEEDDSKMKIEL